jgi:cytochrome c oxidase subunit 2
MVGWVTVMTPSDFEAWRAGVIPNESPAVSGQKLFVTYGCNTCHGERAPTLAGLYMSKVTLSDGSTVIADENYLRESIEYSTAKLVQGYPAIMPGYRQYLTEEQINDLIAYIKTLGTGIATPGPTTGIASQTPTSSPTTPPPPSPSGYSPQQLPDFPPARQPPEIAPPPSVTPQPR